MMYFLLALFFSSLFGITFMIGRKLVMIQNGHIPENTETIFKASYLEEWKHQNIKNIKKYGYIALVVIIRSYIRLANFLKNKYQEMKISLNAMRSKNSNVNLEEKKEVSGFLKMISEYKKKVRRIKEKVAEEESL